MTYLLLTLIVLPFLLPRRNCRSGGSGLHLTPEEQTQKMRQLGMEDGRGYVVKEDGTFIEVPRHAGRGGQMESRGLTQPKCLFESGPLPAVGLEERRRIEEAVRGGRIGELGDLLDWEQNRTT